MASVLVDLAKNIARSLRGPSIDSITDLEWRPGDRLKPVEQGHERVIRHVDEDGRVTVVSPYSGNTYVRDPGFLVQHYINMSKQERKRPSTASGSS